MRSRFLLLALVASPLALIRAQAVEEPPIPVMIVCPYHEDSLRRAYEAGLTSYRDDGRQTLDSASLSTLRASEALAEQVERSFIYLYLFLGILAIISIAALRVAYRLRNELQGVRDAQRSPHLALPSPVIVESAPLRRRSARSPASRPKRTPASSSRKSTRPRRPRA